MKLGVRTAGTNRVGVDWFNGYTAKMRSQIPSQAQAVLDEFDMKVQHTFYVRDRSEDIACWLNLPAKEFKLASLCGLYHDLGRFVQAVNFGTMDDRITGSHADLSAEVFLRETPHDGLTAEEVSLIEQALRYHNLYRLPEALSAKTLLFSQLTRDADKLDIFRHMIDLNTGQEKRKFRFVQYEAEGRFKPELINAVLQGENLNASRVQSQEDRLLLGLSLIYNLNFGISFQQTLAMRYVEQLTSGYTDSALAEVTAYAINYMQERLEQGREGIYFS